VKLKQILFVVLLALNAYPAWTQGTFTFIYDQQSATETDIVEGAISNLKIYQPVGQSFTPALSLDVILRSDSISGPILGTSDPVSLAANTSGYPNFFFPTPISVTPGTTYFLQLGLLSGNEGVGLAYPRQYLGGSEYVQGIASPGGPLWFREGIVVPEPSTWALLLLGGGAWLVRKCRR
jgi:hypothetical protein